MAAPLTREQILNTTEQVLRRFGLDKTSVVDVARALGVSHGTLYRHFSSKAALKEAVAERWLHEVSAPLAIIVENAGSALEKTQLWLERLIHIKQSKALEDPELFAMYNALAEESVESIEKHINDLISQLTQIVEEGMQAGEFQNADAREVASAVFYATARFHHPALAKEWISPAINHEFEQVWNLLVSGLLIRK
ncbi:TetR family transcriptional regulator [Fictibacillus sp. BK138]|jgi:AcrR family transcriptional regulator|uniref:TetR family transcriptional regulator n=1 Tax=Fictibacillus sp. BK138 TaxID=2512121 RepID=UPI00102999B9|nr:TetR family transcriptional regulator [Fictibacillus sp. BK138]RZT23755.1 TetR family transcriptional regulator [Fictibacillus sp. BK138]